MGAAAESKDRVIDQANAEYEAYTAGKLYRRLGTTNAPGGKVEYCGDEDDLSQWTVTYVRAHDNAVTPLTCGDRDRALGDFERLDRADVAFWSEVEVPPPVLLVDGVHHHFQPARGRVLLGVVELVERAVLLVAVGTRMVAVYREGGVCTVLPLGRPCTIREIDLAHLLDYYRPRAASRRRAQDEPLRPSPQTQAHHIRIVHGRPIDVGAGPQLPEVLAAIFEDIEARATAPKDRPKGKRLKGKTWVPLVLMYLRKLCGLGCRDLVGLTGKIIAEIQEHFPEFAIKAEAFADVLKLIAATGTGLIAPRARGARIWRIHLAELPDPTSALHKRLCRETADRLGVDEAANQTSATGSPPPSGRTGAPAEDAGPPRSQEEATATEGKSRGDAEDGSTARGEPSEPGAPAPGDAAGHAEPRSSALDPAVEAAALRLVNHFSKDPQAGPMLLTWTLQTQGLAELGSTAANGGAEREQATAVKAVSGRDRQIPVGSDPPAVDEHEPQLEHILASVATSVLDSGGGDERRPANDAGDEHEQVTAVKADSVRDQQLPGEADPPGGSEDKLHLENLVASVATAVVDADNSDERRLADGQPDAPAVEAPDPLDLPDRFVRQAARQVALVRAPLGDADLIGRCQVFTLIKSELQRRSLGTLGPRGPPTI